MEPMIGKSTQGLSFIWPDSLDKIGLSKPDVDVLEKHIRIGQGDLLAKRNAKLINQKPSPCLKAQKIKVLLEENNRTSLSRTVYITNNFAIIVLNGNLRMDPIPAGSKWAYDPIMGEYFIQRKWVSMSQEYLYKYVNYSLGDSERQGFGEMVLLEHSGQTKYFEKYCPTTLEKLPRPINADLNIKTLVALQDALRVIHLLEIQPSTIIRVDTRESLTYSKSGPCFHGAIIPSNILCQFEGSAQNELIFRLGSYQGILDYGMVFKLDAWASPETVKWGLTKNRYKEMTPQEFNRNFGQKRDAWAFGLLMGSLILGGFSPKCSQLALPNFSFIIDRLKINGDFLDCSGLSKLSQKEVDCEIDGIVDQIDPNDPVAENVSQCWKIIKLWLRVNPDDRATLANAYIKFREY